MNPTRTLPQSLFATALLLLLPAMAFANPDPKACCNCIEIQLLDVPADQPGQPTQSFPFDDDGNATVRVSVSLTGSEGCTGTISGTVYARPTGAETTEVKSLPFTGAQELEFQFNKNDARISSSWEFYIVCGESTSGASSTPSECPQKLPFNLGEGCDSCGETCDGYTGESSMDEEGNINIPTTRSQGGISQGSLYYRPGEDFGNPGVSALYVNVPSNFIVLRAPNGNIISVNTGNTLIEIAPADAALLALDPKAFTITHKSLPGEAVFRITTISFVNEEGEDRLRMDSFFDGATTRHELTKPGDYILKRGRVVGGTFHALAKHTFAISKPSVSNQVRRLKTQQRPTIDVEWSHADILSDVETTWERQFYRWQQIINPAIKY